jgi:hypothetical protein
MGRMRNAEKILVRRCEGRPRCRLEDNIKMDFRETEFEGVDWIQLAHDRVQ